MSGRAAYIEVQTLEHAQRVAAIDAETGVEVVIMAPRGASQMEVERVALAKLERALAARATPASPPPAPPPRKGGVLA